METVKLEDWRDIKELVLMSIGTDKGSWWADPSFGSDLWQIRKAGKITGKTSGIVQRMIIDCLEWLIADEVASDITCDAELTDKNAVSYHIIIFRPGGQRIEIEEVWNAVVA